MSALRLILLRHAKSDWADPEQPDHDRLLNRRGSASADALGRWMAENGYLPDQVLCSSARRTRETWERLSRHLPETAVEFDKGLYLAGPAAMRGRLDHASGKTVMVIGHNPGVGDFAAQMASKPPAHPKFEQYPTGATLVLDFDAVDWAAISPRRGAVVDFIVPRDLMETGPSTGT